MKIGSRFTVAVHILTLIEIDSDNTLTSNKIAKSVNTNPVVIRRLMGKLKNADLIRTSQGNTGIMLLKPLNEITLFEVYKAVEAVEKGQLFQIHENSNIECIVGENIQAILEVVLEDAQDAMESVLKNITVDSIVDQVLAKKR